MSETFRYRAATGAGDVVEGVVRASSIRDASESLRRQSLVPVQVEPAVTGATRASLRPRAGRREAMAAAVRTLATLVSAGLPLERSLEFVARNTTHADTAVAFSAIRLGVQRGESLSTAVREHDLLGGFAASVIRAGEESGTLEAALVRLAEWNERAAALRAQVRSALLYPALMGIVAGAGVIVLLVFVVPRFVAILGDVGGTLPLTTRLLVGASRAITRGWWVWLPLLAVAVFGARWWMRDPRNIERWDGARLRVPILGVLERSAMTARFTNALGVLLAAGTPVLAALRVAGGGIANRALARDVNDAIERVARGERVADSLRPALPPLAVELLGAGEEGGSLADMCLRVSEVHETAVAQSLQSLTRLLEPALILLFGAIVGFIALAMLQAVYSVNAGVL